MAIFNSYVKLPEGIHQKRGIYKSQLWYPSGPSHLGGISRDGALWRRPTYSHQFRHAFEWLGHDLVMKSVASWWSKMVQIFQLLDVPWAMLNPWVAWCLCLLEQHCPCFWSSKPVAASHRILSFLVLQGHGSWHQLIFEAKITYNSLPITSSERFCSLV